MSGRKTWVRKITVKDGSYEGEVDSEGRPHGKGIRKWNIGDSYQGQFTTGRPDNRGVFTYGTGQKYDGEWKMGKKEGKGTFTMKNGAKFVGNSKDWFDYKTQIPMIGTAFDKHGNQFNGEWIAWRDGDTRYFVEKSKKMILNRKTGEVFSAELKKRWLGKTEKWVGQKRLPLPTKTPQIPAEVVLVDPLKEEISLLRVRIKSFETLNREEENRRAKILSALTKTQGEVKTLSNDLSRAKRDQTVQRLSFETTLREKGEVMRRMKIDFDRKLNEERGKQVQTLLVMDQKDQETKEISLKLKEAQRNAQKLFNSLNHLKEEHRKQGMKIEALQRVIREKEGKMTEVKIELVRKMKELTLQKERMKYLAKSMAEMEKKKKGDVKFPSVLELRVPSTKIVKHASIDESQFLMSKSIGRGNAGVVYKYRLLINGKETLVAAKYFDQKVSDSVVIAECKKLTSIQHVNFPKCFGYFIGLSKTGKNVLVRVIFMELCKESLDQFITRLQTKENACSAEKKVQIIKQIAEGMKYLHEMRVVHRDLKPSNVLLTFKGDAKIVDFDISRIVDLNSVVKLTRVAGTAFFVAPEILSKQEEHDAFCDVFGFGVLSYCLFFEVNDPNVLKNLLYSGYDNNSIVGQNKIASLLSQETWKPSFPKKFDLEKCSKKEKELVKLIMRCCRVDPFDRPSFKRIVQTMKKRME